jgi:hypothetical protein
MVFDDKLLVKTNAIRNSPQEEIKVNIPVVKRAGPESGKTILNSTWEGEHPSIRAESSISLGIVWKYPLRIHIAIGSCRAEYTRMSKNLVSSRCTLDAITYRDVIRMTGGIIWAKSRVKITHCPERTFNLTMA